MVCYLVLQCTHRWYCNSIHVYRPNLMNETTHDDWAGVMAEVTMAMAALQSEEMGLIDWRGDIRLEMRTARARFCSVRR